MLNDSKQGRFADFPTLTALSKKEAASAMQKWDYCWVTVHPGRLIGDRNIAAECAIHREDQEVELLRGEEAAIPKVLSQLGDEGWEAVDYSVQVGNGAEELKFLFKRPA
jgi:hypothetical protein